MKLATKKKRSTKNTRAAESKGRSKSPKRIQLSKTIEMVPPLDLEPAKVNNAIYNYVSQNNPAVVELAKDIEEKGQVLEALVVTIDNVVVSGHRRRAGAIIAGISKVPVRRINISSTDPRFERYLVSFNKQRVKTAAEQIREEIARTSPEDAHNTLLAHRKIEAAKAHARIEDSELRIIDLSSARRRCEISDAKRLMLDAAKDIVRQYQEYWPLTLRQIHYRMLNKHVLRNSADPTSLYVNSQKCYKDLSNLLTRARLTEELPWQSMHDPTRPRTNWRQWNNAGDYMREQSDSFLGTYKRNLLQNQPSYIELVVEKLTVLDIAKRAAGPYHVPLGVGKGYTSVTSLSETADRFYASGKDHFLLLLAGDLDPEGENIAETWGNCLLDEHDVENLTVVKVGVNPDQVEEYDLSPLPIKETSSRAARFEAEHGRKVYELEAFEPNQLQTIIRESIRSVLDLELFAEEQRRESEEARLLIACKQQFQEFVKAYDFGNLDQKQ